MTISVSWIKQPDDKVAVYYYDEEGEDNFSKLVAIVPRDQLGDYVNRRENVLRTE